MTIPHIDVKVILSPFDGRLHFCTVLPPADAYGQLKESIHFRDHKGLILQQSYRETFEMGLLQEAVITKWDQGN